MRKHQNKKGQKVNTLKTKDIQRIFEYLLSENYIVMYAIVKFALNTGLRISDILKLKFEDLNKNEVLEIKTQKNKFIFFNKECKETSILLAAYYKNLKIKNYKSDFLFKSLKNKNRQITYQGVNFYIKKIKKDLKIDYPVNTHSFRKTWAREVYFSSKKDIAMVMRMLNHSNPAITLRYIEVEDDCFKKIYSKIKF